MPSRNVNLAAEFRSSGKTQHAFCTERGVSIATLRYYLYKKRYRQVSLKQPAQKSGTVSASPAFLSFNREPFTNKSSSRHCTIIQGTFSIAEIAELLSGVS
jgi:hypothetical protein